MVDSRLIAYTDRYALTPIYQFAQPTVVTITRKQLQRLYNDTIHVVDRREVGALVLLDISASFDTVDHRFMADVFHRRFDIRGDALAQFVSYFDDRTQVVTVSRDTSLASSLSTGVRPTGFGVGAKVICNLRRGCARNFRIPAGYMHVPPVR